MKRTNRHSLESLVRRLKLYAVKQKPALLLLLVLGCITSIPVDAVRANDKESLKESMKTVRFTVQEGSWITVDVSPDGKTLVFDLLGHLYTLPIEGGTASPLAHHAWAWDASPRFSPDGEKIAFISDRGGTRRLWVVDLQEKEYKQVKGLMGEKQDGQGSFVTTGFAPGVGGTPKWLHPGLVVATRFRAPGRVLHYFDLGTDQSTVLELPIPDSSQIEGAAFPNRGSADSVIAAILEEDESISNVKSKSATHWYRLYRIDRDERKVVRLTVSGAPYHEFKPEVSRSGKLLAYIRYYSHEKSELRLQDLHTGRDKLLAPLEQVDEPDRLGNEESYPGYAFTPDDRSIVIWQNGGLYKVSIVDGQLTRIPFVVSVNREVTKPLRPRGFSVVNDDVSIRAVRWPSVSAGLGTVVFSAVGDLWIYGKNQRARRLPAGSGRNIMPSLSPDGSKVAFISVPSLTSKAGRLRILYINSGELDDIADHEALYTFPIWSPDGSKLAVFRRSDERDSKTANYGWVDATDGSFHKLGDVPAYYADVGRPNPSAALSYAHSLNLSWSEEGDSLFVPIVLPGVPPGGRPWDHSRTWANSKLALSEVALSNGKQRIIALADRSYIKGILASPGLSNAILIGHDNQAYITSMNYDGLRPVELSLDSSDAHQISSDGALYAQWLGNTNVLYGYMRNIYAYSLDKKESRELATININLPKRQSRSEYAIENARLITVANDSGPGPVIESGTIVVKGRRIVAVGESGILKAPNNVPVIDGSGLTIMPGIVDVHYHGLPYATSVNSLDRALAYGITTAFEPGGGSLDDRSVDWQTAVDAGIVRGPRFLFDSHSNAIVVRTSAERSAHDQMREAIGGKRDRGAGPCLKTFWAHTDRVKARLLTRLADVYGFCVINHTTDRAGVFSSVIDGAYPHHWPVPSPLYEDEKKFLIQSRTILSPHLVLSAAGAQSQGSMMQWHVANMHKKLPISTLKRLEDWHQGDSRASSHHHQFDLDESWDSARTASEIIALMRAGGRVAISGDNNVVADSRAEMALFQERGASPGDIIRSVTMVNAEELGLEKEIGSLEAGKLADFIALTENPLDDVINTILLKWTAVDGVLYDSESLDVIRPGVNEGTTLSRPSIKATKSSPVGGRR